MNQPKKSWPPFEEARREARTLKCSTADEYAKQRPSHLPSAPYYTYRNSGWTNWFDFLGNGISWLPFEEARRVTQGLKLANSTAYSRHSGRKFLRLPSNPGEVYRDSGWAGWQDFLGTELVKLSYEETRALVRKAGIKTGDEYRAFYKAYGRSIPSYPDKFPEFTGMNDFLGNKISYEEARREARARNYRNVTDYHKNRPQHLPFDPRTTFREEFVSWGDYLGIDESAPRLLDSEEVSFGKARVEARKLGFKSAQEYWADPPVSLGLPRHPEQAYAGKGWLGWADFLGVKYLPYKEARELARTLGFKSVGEYQSDTSGRRPKNLPVGAKSMYEKDWLKTQEGKECQVAGIHGFWQDFLNIPPGKFSQKKWLPFDEARQVARNLHCKSVDAYEKCYANYLDKGMYLPCWPPETYKGQFISWSDFLGCEISREGKTPKEIVEEYRQSLQELLDLSEHFSEADLIQIAQDMGVLHNLRNRFPGKSLSEVIVILKKNGIRHLDRQPRVIRKTQETGLSITFVDDSARVSEASLRSVDRAASRGVREKTLQRLADSQLARLRNKYIDEGFEAVSEWVK